MTAQALLGLWGSKIPKRPWLEFLDDGKVVGSDGCNRLFGTWSEAQDVEFIALAGTRMFCEGVDDWLARASTGKLLDDGSLAIFDQDNNELGILVKDDQNS
ncbi:META domain-containing protein [Glutamicibacter sp.]|uniref:META domain-containing protein n=1 Tax=Glutamicibacter sp. TaxID=1931995 RepID=UPI002FDF72F7